ncbi:MAG: UDP-phosphate galactose phosphotransferase [Actinomycetota bacterium]|jgi:exopolysaccharide biosynthesis polyprenyl glycosylphosphotransferase|nr:MAG: UDP-phosphate galactose phosphotransferase [Actinomycetota bacterium]
MERLDLTGREEAVAALGTAERVRVLDLEKVRPSLQRFRLVVLARALTDVAIALALVAAFRGSTSSVVGYGVTLGLAPIAWAACFAAFGLYRRALLPPLEEFRRIVAATSVAVLGLEAATPLWDGSIARGRVALLWGSALLAELLARGLWRAGVRSLRRRGTLALRTAIVGRDGEAARIAAAIVPPARGYRPVGFVTDTPEEVPGSVLGGFDDLERIVLEEGIECLFVASSEIGPNDMTRLGRLSRRYDLELRVAANLPDVHTERLDFESVGDFLALRVHPARLTGPQAAAKRAFDLVLGSIGLVLAAPVMLAVAIAVRLTSPGPVLFRQPRVTKDGRIFTCLKFRTMHTDQRAALEDAVIDLTKPFFKLRDDPRLTPIGAFLRRTSLDELPQLWNVVRGDMSLVGPRPLWEEQVRANPELLEARHEVRAGLTGWWQVNGRSDVDPEQAVRMDLYYIQNWSIGLDLYILAKTVIATIARMGAY